MEHFQHTIFYIPPLVFLLKRIFNQDWLIQNHLEMLKRVWPQLVLHLSGLVSFNQKFVHVFQELWFKHVCLCSYCWQMTEWGVSTLIMIFIDKLSFSGLLGAVWCRPLWKTHLNSDQNVQNWFVYFSRMQCRSAARLGTSHFVELPASKCLSIVTSCVNGKLFPFYLKVLCEHQI